MASSEGEQQDQIFALQYYIQVFQIRETWLYRHLKTKAH